MPVVLIVGLSRSKPQTGKLDNKKLPIGNFLLFAPKVFRSLPDAWASIRVYRVTGHYMTIRYLLNYSTFKTNNFTLMLRIID